jgi:hypothetical protein
MRIKTRYDDIFILLQTGHLVDSYYNYSTKDNFMDNCIQKQFDFIQKMKSL